MFWLWKTSESPPALREEILTFSSLINQTIAIRTIRNLGFPVTAVWNGKQALSYLLNPSATQPRPDIILMDIQMPVMDGYEATKILRTAVEYGSDGQIDTEAPQSAAGNDLAMQARNTVRLQLKDIPVIAMTASAIQGDKERCHDAGMDDYLAKPVEKKLLEAKLVKWAGRRRHEISKEPT